MVRKARLDEIDLDFPPEEDEQLQGGTDEDEEEKQRIAGDEDYEEDESENGGESRFSFLGEKTRLAIFCILGCLLIAGVVWGTWYFVGTSKQPSPFATSVADSQTQEQKETIPFPSPNILLSHHIFFHDFVVPLPEGAKFLFLEVSFAVEVAVIDGKEVQKGNISDDPGVRRQIINAIQSRGRDLLPAKNSRALVKNDLLNLMTQILGENVVKNVYITEFTFI